MEQPIFLACTGVLCALDISVAVKHYFCQQLPDRPSAVEQLIVEWYNLKSFSTVHPKSCHPRFLT